MNPLDPLEQLNQDIRRAFENGMLVAACLITLGIVLCYVYVKCFETPHAPAPVQAQKQAVNLPCEVTMTWGEAQSHTYTGNIQRASID